MYSRLKRGRDLAALGRKGARVYRGQTAGVSGEDGGAGIQCPPSAGFGIWTFTFIFSSTANPLGCQTPDCVKAWEGTGICPDSRPPLPDHICVGGGGEGSGKLPLSARWPRVGREGGVGSPWAQMPSRMGPVLVWTFGLQLWETFQAQTWRHLHTPLSS